MGRPESDEEREKGPAEPIMKKKKLDTAPLNINVAMEERERERRRTYTVYTQLFLWGGRGRWDRKKSLLKKKHVVKGEERGGEGGSELTRCSPDMVFIRMSLKPRSAK